LSRVLIASNRLPVTLRVDHGELRVTQSAGGLATAMAPVHREGDSLWFGYPGEPPKGSEAKVQSLLADMRLRPIAISPAEIARYYDGFANGVLWPLFHYLLDTVRRDADRDFSTYRAVNQRFCDAIVAEHRPGDIIWVHDYQLLLLPGMLRERLPSATIGFFLHVPFPSADVFRTLPHREAILRGLLGADLLGFHTASYRHNFAHAAAHVVGVELGIDALRFEDRQVELGVHPIGIDVANFERIARDPKTGAEVAELRAATGGKTILLGVDRLDYTKGLRRRLLAIDRMLEREPALRDKIHFIQLAVPSRELVEAYAGVRSDVNELVGRINAHHGSPTSAPIQLLYRSVSLSHLVALYRAADVMLVTPLRDGMNLVAKEYVASRVDEDGVLVLSEFAGAASELEEAISVNPYDVGDLATQIRRAIALPAPERKARMRALRRRVGESDVRAWVDGFLGLLGRAAEGRASSHPSMVPPALLDGLNESLDRRSRGERRLILLDYDGTLVPYAPVPELASPDEDLLALLRRLGERPTYDVHIITGRSRVSIEPWLSGLPLTIHAEHGAFSQVREGQWTAMTEPPAWIGRVGDFFETVSRRTPGSFVERKAASVAFHYRRSDPTLAGDRIRELRSQLERELPGEDAEALDGNKVIEVRVKGVDKGGVAKRLALAGQADLIVAAGDDRTDEDMFRALPDDALTIRVGRGATHARYRIDGPPGLRAVLERLIELP